VSLQTHVLGAVYTCPVCKTQLVVLAPAFGQFDPHCCNRAMIMRPERLTIYRCETCGAELVAMAPQPGQFKPVCCSLDMVPKAA